MDYITLSSLRSYKKYSNNTDRSFPCFSVWHFCNYKDAKINKQRVRTKVVKQKKENRKKKKGRRMKGRMGSKK